MYKRQLQGRGIGLHAHDVDGGAYRKFFSGIVDLDGCRRSAGHERPALREVIDAFVIHANHVRRAVVGDIDFEVAGGVGLGAADLGHALRERQDNNFVARGRLAAGAVEDLAGDGAGRGRRNERGNGENRGENEFQTQRSLLSELGGGVPLPLPLPVDPLE